MLSAVKLAEPPHKISPTPLSSPYFTNSFKRNSGRGLVIEAPLPSYIAQPESMT